jgi:hypothetical protein
MKETIKEILKEHAEKESNITLSFFLCFNLLDDNCPLSSGEIRKTLMDALEEVEE